METNERAKHLHDQVLAARRALRSAERAVALLLAELADDGLYRVLGYVSVAEYAAATLDLTARQTRDLLRLGRRLPELPVLDRALAEGRLDWTKARELVRVVTPETESAWVERAVGKSARVVEREVAAATHGEPPPSGEPEAGPSRVRLVFDVDSADAQLIRDGIARMRAAVDLDREEVEDGALLAAMVRRGLEAEAAADAPTAEAWRVVIDVCPNCQEARVGDAEVSDAVMAEAACDAERVDVRPGPEQGRLSRAVPPATRRAVVHRHRGRCAVPGCANRLWLHVHHLRSRVCGGDHAAGNLVTVCPAHHRAIHEGRFGLERGASGEVVVFRRQPTHVLSTHPGGFRQNQRLNDVPADHR